MHDPEAPKPALEELQQRYDDLAHQHHLLTIRYVHRTFLLQAAARMLEASSYTELWREVEDALAGLGGMPRFWVLAYPQTGPICYASEGIVAHGPDPGRAALDGALSRRADPLADAVVEVPLADGGALGCLHFSTLRGGLAIYSESSQAVSSRWRSEHELLDALRAILPSAIESLARRQLMAEAATRDALTGLLNRREFEQRMVEELARGARQSAELSLMMVDLDHFKQVNDSHGHLVGDIVLQELALRLQGALRLPDVVARWGGEEFVVLLPDCSAGQARQVAERLRMAIVGRPFEVPGIEGGLRISASFGIASLDADGPPRRDALLAQADAAMYRAKHDGRDRVVVFEGHGERSA